MLPVCLLLGFLIGVLLSRYYSPKNKTRKCLFAILLPLSAGVAMNLIMAAFHQSSMLPFGYILGTYTLFTVLPAIVAMITLLVKLKVEPVSDTDSSEKLTIEKESTIEVNKHDDIVPDDVVVDDSNTLENTNQKEQSIETEEVRHFTESIIQIGDGVQHVVKITSNVECTVYLDCEKIGVVSDGKMIKISINDGPYLLRCVSIYDEVVEHSFELSKDELFNFKFCITDAGKSKKGWFSR